MKLILLAFLVLIVCPPAGNSQVKIDWQTTKIGDTCRPSIAWSTGSDNLSIYAARLNDLQQPDRYQRDLRTYDGGKNWILFADSMPFASGADTREFFTVLDHATYFWKGTKQIVYTLDSGRSRVGLPAFPIPFRFHMNSPDSGIGLITETLNGESAIDLRGTVDSGRYWYENTGTVFSTPLLPYDAQFLSDSEVIVLLLPKKSDGRSAVVKTSDRGTSWNEVYSFPAGDSIYPLNVSYVKNTGILLMENAGDNALMISYDRGGTWQRLQDDLDMTSTRTRALATPGAPISLWAATASNNGGPLQNLFEPNSFESIFPSHIKLSLDTGRTWVEQDFYPPGFDSVQIFDIIPDGDKLYVVSYLDSTTYVSTATISGFGSVKSDDVTTPMINLYPNPAIGHAVLSLEDSRIHVTSFVVVDALGSRRATGSVEEGRLDLAPSRLTAGSYTVLLYMQGNQVAQSKLIVQ